jgi:hypothetical protein
MGTSHGVRPSFMALGDAVAAYWLTAPPKQCRVFPTSPCAAETSCQRPHVHRGLRLTFRVHSAPLFTAPGQRCEYLSMPKKTSESTFMVRQGTFPSRANNGGIQADAIAQPADQLSDAHASENTQNLRYACGLVIRHPRLLGSRPHGTWSPHPPQPPRDS